MKPSLKVIEPGDPQANDPLFCEWLRDNGIRPEDTYRVEIGARHLIAYRYKRGADGRIVVNRDGEHPEPEVLAPLSVPIERPIPW